jgi:hypothetical protein
MSCVIGEIRENLFESNLVLVLFWGCCNYVRIKTETLTWIQLISYDE